MSSLTILAPISIIVGIGILAASGFMAAIDAIAQEMMENITAPNMTTTGGNASNATSAGTNMTEATGEISRKRCGGLCNTHSLM